MTRANADHAVAGFTLIEVLMTSFVFTIIVLGVGGAVLSTHRVVGGLQDGHLVFAHAETILDTLVAIRFGRPSETDPAQSDVEELLDSNTFRGGISLHQFRKRCPLEFELDGFPVPGRWTVEVSDDLNGDGDVTDPLEGREDLLRIEVRHEGSMVARTFRAAPTLFDEPGEGNVLFGDRPPGDEAPPALVLLRGRSTHSSHLGFQVLKDTVWAQSKGPGTPGKAEGKGKH